MVVRTRDSKHRNESVLENVLFNPPTTDVDSGNWDSDGSLRGYVLTGSNPGDGVVDVIIEATPEYHGRQCYILRCTRYNDTSAMRRDGGLCEKETWYVGKVHAPAVDSLPAGVYGTYVRECHPETNWFAWSERHWQNGATCTETRSEMAHRKTKRLAQGVKNRANGVI